MKDETGKSLAKAERAVAAADTLLAAGDADLSAGRACSATFSRNPGVPGGGLMTVEPGGRGVSDRVAAGGAAPCDNAAVTRSGASRERLRARLAALGVPLFHARPRGPSSAGEEEYAELLGTLLRAGDARLRSAIPCLLAAHDGAAAARATRSAIATLPADEAATLALLYRVARYLARSRAPDLRHLRGRVPRLGPLAEEPDDLPDPGERHGEAGLAAAADRITGRDGSDLVGGAARTFDTWLRLLGAEKPAREPA